VWDVKIMGNAATMIVSSLKMLIRIQYQDYSGKYLNLLSVCLGNSRGL
jgi:hypothetical protein